MIFQLKRKLAEKGLMGMNRRNAEYILKYNPRRLFPLVDDKLETKRLAEKAGIAVPSLYGVVEIERHIRDLPKLLKPHSDFVVKPAHGSGGDGILVITGRAKVNYRKASGLLMTEDEIKRHVSNILSGMYSLAGYPDKTMIEQRVQFDPIFEPISYQGVPDIRIIVFLGVPVMAMSRLPTRMSEGKANLHLGAIGVGIDISSGTTLTAAWRNEIVSEHPDTGNTVTGVKIPNWEALLSLAARSYELSGLGYQGVDIVLDKNRGPLVLELNARPGLNIQIANNDGLLRRLRIVEDYGKDLESIQKRIDFAREHFGDSEKISQGGVQ
jgi:alpha-L-glutamate ligase-like protein